MLISIILFFISLISFLIFIILLFLNKFDAVFLLIMFASMMSYLFSYIVFNKITKKYPLNDVQEYHTKNFKKLLVKHKDCFTIQFFKKDGFWICETDKESIKINLNGYLFQHQYLVSFVIRNLRYPLINNKLPLKYLFKNKFFIKKNLNIKIVIYNGDKRIEKMIVKNGISRYGIIAQNITFSPFYLEGLSNRTYQSFVKRIACIDERICGHFYKK